MFYSAYRIKGKKHIYHDTIWIATNKEWTKISKYWVLRNFKYGLEHETLHAVMRKIGEFEANHKFDDLFGGIGSGSS